MFSQARLIGGGLALVALLAFGGWVHLLSKKAADRDRAVAELASATESFNARLQRAERLQKEAEAKAARLLADLGDVRAKFAALPAVVPKTLLRIVEVPGAPCPAVRIADDFRLHWNAVSTTGSAAP